MGTYAFLVTMGAVLCANLLTVAFVFCMWKIARLDRQYGDQHGYKAQPAHFPYLLGVVMVCGAVLIALYLASNPPALAS